MTHMLRTALLLSVLAATPALADAPVVEAVEARQTGGTWSFDVTVSHPDTGWEHYADGWSVETLDGTQLGYRELLHPHETEQPFRRSLSGVVIPDGTAQVQVRAHGNVHGWGAPVVVDLAP